MIKLDNGLTFIGSASGKRNISRSMSFLLKNNVIPVFAVPRKPFTQASIEGNNSVLSEWNLNNETLNIYFEKDKTQKLITEIDFKINKKYKDNFDVC